MNSFLIVDNVSYTYDDKEYAVSDVSFAWNSGILAVKGVSGSGKTTLLKLVAGLLKPDEGQILIEGKPLSEIPIKKRKIGFVFQQSNLYPHLTVYQNLLASNKDTQAVKYRLEQLDLQKYVNFLPKQLSSGLKQKIAVAKLLASDSELWLLDEPTANLDEPTAEQVTKLLREEGKGRCVLHVSHQTLIADDSVTLHEGRLIK